MKIRTSDLADAAFDWAMAKACGFNIHHNELLGGYTMHGFWVSGYHPNDLNLWIRLQEFRPSIDWTQGGPIIERKNIALYPHGDGTYEAEVFLNPKRGAGPTPLIAAMRCLVASKLGDEVEVPDELTQASAPESKITLNPNAVWPFR